LYQSFFVSSPLRGCISRCRDHEGPKDTKRHEEEKSVVFFVLFVELRVFVVAFRRRCIFY